MQSIKYAILCLAILLLLGLETKAQEGVGYKIIVNSENSIDSASASEASRWFLKKTTSWEDGTVIQPIDMSSDSGIREEFTRHIHGKSTSAIKSYWQKLIFSGRATPPVESKSEQDVIDFVRSNIGAVGYIAISTEAENVKTITITK